MSPVRVVVYCPKEVRTLEWAEQTIDWFAQHGGRPDIVGGHFPPGVRLVEHENDVVAALYKQIGAVAFEFDDAALALMFKLTFGGR
jgi:hypothetical protein